MTRLSTLPALGSEALAQLEEKAEAALEDRAEGMNYTAQVTVVAKPKELGVPRGVGSFHMNGFLWCLHLLRTVQRLRNPDVSRPMWAIRNEDGAWGQIDPVRPWGAFETAELHPSRGAALYSAATRGPGSEVVQLQLCVPLLEPT